MTSIPSIEKSLTPNLNDLLDSIGEKLQISKTAYDQAKDRYRTITEWLNKPESRLALYKPHIFSQGSLKIRTTIKPSSSEEYDLDLVCLLNTTPETFGNATHVLDLIENRLNENGSYKGKVERKNRCIRLNYANEFHMDILPACPDPSPNILDQYGKHCVKVPDCSLQDWKHSNPKGYAMWFENKAIKAIKNFGKARKSHEPLPEQISYEQLAVLPRVVQLMKRHRDITLQDLEVKERPISIVLTTLAARSYNGSLSVIDALEHILFNIKLHIEFNATQGRHIVVPNPTNQKEILSERWSNDPQLYKTFTNWIVNFSNQISHLRKLATTERGELLKEMFGETAVQVTGDFAKKVAEVKNNGNLAIDRFSGIIVTQNVPESVPVKDNNYHGDF